MKESIYPRILTDEANNTERFQSIAYTVEKDYDLYHHSHEESSSTSESLEDLQNQITTLESKVTTLQYKVSTLESDTTLSDTVATLTTTTSDLQTQLTELSEQVDSIDGVELSAEIETLTTTATELQEQLTALDTKVSSLEEADATISEDVATLTSTAEALQDKVTEIETKVGDLEDVDSTLSDAITTLTSTTSDIQDQVTTLNDKVTALEDDTSLADEIDGIKSSISDLESKISALEEDSTNADAITALQERVTTLETKVSELESDTTNADAITALQERVTTLENNSATDEDAITALQEADATINESIATLNTNVTTNTDSIATIQEKVTALEDNSSSLAYSISTLTTNVSTNTDAITALQEADATIATAIDTINENISTNADAITVLQGVDTETAAAITTIQEQIATLQESDASITESIATLNTNVTTNADAITALQEADTTTSESITTIQEQITALQESDSTTASTISTIQEQIAELQNVDSTTSDTISSMSSNISANTEAITANTTNDTVTADSVTALQEEIAALQSTISSITFELSSLKATVLDGTVEVVGDTLTTSEGNEVTVTVDASVVDSASVTSEVSTLIEEAGVTSDDYSVLTVTDVTLTDADGNTVESSDVLDEDGVQLKLYVAGVTAGSSYYIMHYTSAGEWEVIIPDEVGDGYVIATFTSLSPIVVVEGEAPEALLYDITDVEIDAVALFKTMVDNLFNTVPNYDRSYTNINTTSTKYYTALGTIEESALDSIIIGESEILSSDTRKTYVGESGTATSPIYLISSNILYIHTLTLVSEFENTDTTLKIYAGGSLFQITSTTTIFNDTELTVSGATYGGNTVSTQISASYEDGVVTGTSSNGYQYFGIAVDGVTNAYSLAIDSNGDAWITLSGDDNAFYFYPEYTVKDYTEESSMSATLTDIYVVGAGHISNITFNIDFTIYLPEVVYSCSRAAINNYLKQADYANTIILSGDIVCDSQLGINTSAKIEKTIDLNGYNITGISDKTTVTTNAIKVSSTTLNIIDSVGTGSVHGGSGSASNVAVYAYGKAAVINIYGGTYDVGDDVNASGNSTIYSESGTINIYGGTYKNSTSKPAFCLNIKNNTGISFINCYGGSYVNYNPADGDDNDKTYGATFVAEDYIVETSTDDEGNTIYTVVSDPTVAKVSNSDELAIALTDESITKIKLTDDLSTVTDGTPVIEIARSLTLELNGHNVSSVGTETAAAIKVTAGDVVINDSVGTSNITASGATDYNICVWAKNSSVIINAGTYVSGTAGTTEDGEPIYASGTGAININGGTFSNASGAITTHHPDWTYVINIQNNSGASITCYGGSYLNQNPANGDDEDTTTGATFLADGYTVETSTTDDGTWYTVVEDTSTAE